MDSNFGDYFWCSITAIIMYEAGKFLFDKAIAKWKSKNRLK